MTTLAADRTLGTSSIAVPPLGIGCNAFGTRIDEERSHAVVDRSLELGVTFFDTADVYGSGRSEELLGRALQGRRERAVVATKFGMDFAGSEPSWGRPGSATYVRAAVESSLGRLRTDYIDLYQLHQPDPETPLEETITALEGLVSDGTIRAYGCSNFTAAEVRAATDVARRLGATGFVTAQNEYSLYNRAAESDLVPTLVELGMGLLPYFPLAYGLLTGKYRRGAPAPDGTRLALAAQARRLENADWDRIDALQAFADSRGISMLDLAIGGLAAQPGVSSVIAGVTSPAQVESNAAAVSWQPSSEELAALATVNPADGSSEHASFRRS
jgi:aryl-alcohol dehydrogenase-like predicted oxidoreductase